VLNFVEKLEWLPIRLKLGKKERERSHPMKNVIRIGSKRKPKVTPQEMALTSTLNSRVELIQGLIQGLIPIGLSAVGEVLKREVEQLAGIKHGRQGGLPGHYRWGSQEGSIYLSDQKLRVRVPRVRDVVRNREVPLDSYRLLQEPRNADERGNETDLFWTFLPQL
jgi:hypothetical protein